MCIFRENNFSSHIGQTAPQPPFSGQPLEFKTAVKRPVLKLKSSNLGCSFIFHKDKITFSDHRRKTANKNRGGGGKTGVGGGNLHFYLFIVTMLYVKFGCYRDVLKFGGWQLKNGKITGKKQKIGQKVKEWSNGLDLTIHAPYYSMIHQKKIRSLP